MRRDRLLPVVVAGALAQLADGVTRALMPDVAELNLFSRLAGGWVSLLVKLALVVFVVVQCRWLAGVGRPWLALLVAGAALIVGTFGATSNVRVLLG